MAKSFSFLSFSFFFQFADDLKFFKSKYFVSMEIQRIGKLSLQGKLYNISPFIEMGCKVSLENAVNVNMK